MALTTFDGVLAALEKGYIVNFSKASVSTQAAGGQSSLWRATGIPAQGAIPTATALTCATTLLGAFLADGLSVAYPDASTETVYIGMLNAFETLACGFILYDRIMHNGGLSGNTTALTAITGFTLEGIDDRMIASDYSNIHWYAEIYTDIGTTSGVVTVTYDSPTATSQTCTVTIGGTSPANQDSRVFRIYPAAGHPIKKVNSVRLATSTGTAGSWGLTACRPIVAAAIPSLATGGGLNLDFTALGMAKLATAGSCLFAILATSSTSTGQLDGQFKIIKG